MQLTTPTPTPSTASVMLDILIIVSPIALLQMLSLAEELGSTLCNLLQVLGLNILCFLRPAVFRSRLRYIKAFVMYDFFLLNFSVILLLFTYSKLPFLSIQICINIIGVVPEYFRPLTNLEILMAIPPIFFFIEAIFYSIITYESSDDLGFFGQFHRGLWLIPKEISLMMLSCREPTNSPNLLKQPAEPSPPLPDFVSVLPSIPITAHQDYIMHHTPYGHVAMDNMVVLRGDEKMV
jgi:hypothetical protein